jgi:hypothetical protein
MCMTTTTTTAAPNESMMTPGTRDDSLGKYSHIYILDFHYTNKVLHIDYMYDDDMTIASNNDTRGDQGLETTCLEPR